MKRSIRLAAKAYVVALVVGLAAAALAIIAEVIDACLPDSGRTFGLFVGAFFGVFALAAITVFACVFHVAMHDAIGRIEDRERKQRSDDETI